LATLAVEARPITENELRLFDQLEARGLFYFRDREQATCEKLGITPAKSLRQSVTDSHESTMVFVNDELVALWGHGSRDRLCGTGTAWFLALPNAGAVRYRIARVSIHAIEYLLTIYNRLEVFVDAEFLESIKWLEWLGFQQHDAALMHKGFPIIFMYKDRNS
jgi:hypothetical protein